MLRGAGQETWGTLPPLRAFWQGQTMQISHADKLGKVQGLGLGDKPGLALQTYILSTG